MTRIFISYSRRDKPIADYIAAQLRNRGADVFVDYQRLIGGENFIERLGTEIAHCDFFVILLSLRSVDSPWVQAEVAWAFTNRKPIVPVLLETCSMMSLFVLSNLEQVDFTQLMTGGSARESVVKLFIALGLSEQKADSTHLNEVVSVPISVIDKVLHESEDERDSAASVIFSPEDLSELFYTATEVSEDDPEQAVFLYQQIVEIDPDYMNGQAREFIRREEIRLQPVRLEKMLEHARAAIREGHWQQARQIGHDVLILDEGNPNAQRIIEVCQANMRGEPLYKQAVVAVQRERWKPAKKLLQDILETYPQYGDPAGIVPQVYARDPLQLPMLEWCEIPTGQTTIEKQIYVVPAFRMSKYPITNVQYEEFIRHPLGYSDSRWWDYSPDAQFWREHNSQAVPGKFTGNKQPRETVSWYDAVAFCRWLSLVTGQDVTLPTEQMWQWAAQGNDGRTYSWGSEFDLQKCNTLESEMKQTTDVDHYPMSSSHFGVMDMSGNVWEWCLNLSDDTTNVALTGDSKRNARGGSWRNTGDLAGVTVRYESNPPNYRRDNIGFRVVCIPVVKDNLAP